MNIERTLVQHPFQCLHPTSPTLRVIDCAYISERRLPIRSGNVISVSRRSDGDKLTRGMIALTSYDGQRLLLRYTGPILYPVGFFDIEAR